MVKKGGNMDIDISNFKIKHVTEREAKKLWEDTSFHPAYYPSYGSATVLYDGEIGCIDHLKTRFIVPEARRK